MRTQFEHAGQLLSGSIDGHDAEACLFTLDAIADADGTAWFLEMNSNPIVHPDAYGSMIGSCFAASNEHRRAA